MNESAACMVNHQRVVRVTLVTAAAAAAAAVTVRR